MKKRILSLSIIFTCFSSFAQSINIPINIITDEGVGKNIGVVNIAESPYGLLFTPDLKELSPGMHGFHIHENASCAPGLMDGKKSSRTFCRWSLRSRKNRETPWSL